MSNKSVEYFENAYSIGCQQNSSTIVPCKWYTDDRIMPPLYAGMIDGAYNSGESIVTLAQLSWLYFSNDSTKREINHSLAKHYNQLNTELIDDDKWIFSETSELSKSQLFKKNNCKID